MVNELVDGGTSLKEVADDLRCSEIVIDRILALLAEVFDHTFRLDVTLRRNRNTL